MNNTFLDSLKRETNYTKTENGGVAHKSTLNAVYDMFALGGAYRNRTDEDCILLFKNALEENEELALKCLFYLRDVRGGQGERRFFRVCFNWLAKEYPDIAARNLENVPEYGRWDDLYSVVGTKVEEAMFAEIINQLNLDMEALNMGDSFGVSLLAKWLKSENASSKETKKLGDLTRKALGLSHKQYRKILSDLRTRINIVEKLMSEGKWEQIEYAKLPSKAGLIYRNAFARRDAERYEEFINSKETKVNAGTLYPYDIAHKVFNANNLSLNDMERVTIQKYWDALPDFYNGNEENGLCVVDVSGSMYGKPLEAAISLGAYIAERGHGPFANHFITFSEYPKLVKFEGIDIIDKINRCKSADWGMNTNIEAVFDLLLKVALEKNTLPEDIPSRLYILSDQEFDEGISIECATKDGILTLLEGIAKKWESFGYKLPQVIFWNLDARNNNIPAIGEQFTCVSGLSPVLIETVLSGKNGLDLCLEKLLSERYKLIK